MLRFSIGETDPVWNALMKQITRLEQLDRFPFGPEAKKDLGAALAHAESIDDARQVIDEFVQPARAGEKCPLAGDIVALIAARKLRYHPEPHVIFEPETSANRCAHCQDCGLFGGHLDGKYAGPWKWCDCTAGRSKQRDEPNLIDDANANRQKLLSRIAGLKKPAQRVIAEALGEEIYRGEF